MPIVYTCRKNRNNRGQRYPRLSAMILKVRLHRRLIWPISYPDEFDLMVHPRKYSVIFSRIRAHECILLYNIYQDTKSARLIAVCNHATDDIPPMFRLIIACMQTPSPQTCFTTLNRSNLSKAWASEESTQSRGSTLIMRSEYCRPFFAAISRNQS